MNRYHIDNLLSSAAEGYDRQFEAGIYSGGCCACGRGLSGGMLTGGKASKQTVADLHKNLKSAVNTGNKSRIAQFALALHKISKNEKNDDVVRARADKIIKTYEIVLKDIPETLLEKKPTKKTTVKKTTVKKTTGKKTITPEHQAKMQAAKEAKQGWTKGKKPLHVPKNQFDLDIYELAEKYTKKFPVCGKLAKKRTENEATLDYMNYLNTCRKNETGEYQFKNTPKNKVLTFPKERTAKQIEATEKLKEYNKILKELKIKYNYKKGDTELLKELRTIASAQMTSIEDILE